MPVAYHMIIQLVPIYAAPTMVTTPSPSLGPLPPLIIHAQMDIPSAAPLVESPLAHNTAPILTPPDSAAPVILQSPPIPAGGEVLPDILRLAMAQTEITSPMPARTRNGII